MTGSVPAELLPPLMASAIAWCGFDAAWYRQAYAARLPEIAGQDDAALLTHYAGQGPALGLSPNMYFDEAWYLLRNPDVSALVAGGRVGSGYEHYCTLGYLTRSAHWLYDDDVYTRAAPDLSDRVLVEFGCANRYDHYLKAGAREGRSAHLMFRATAYAARVEGGLAAVLDAAHSPFQHFLNRIWSSRADAACSPYFDAAWYLQRNPQARAASAAGRYAGALHHFLAAPDAGDPLPGFVAAHYRATQPKAVTDVTAGRFTGLYDAFLKEGVFALAAPAPGIDLDALGTPARAAVEAGEVRDAIDYVLLNAAPAEPLAEDAVEPVEAVPTATPVVSGVLGFQVDSTIFCPPDGLLLIGWLLASPGLVRGLRLVCGTTAIAVDPARFVPSARPDALAGLADAGFEDQMCGFMALVTGEIRPGEQMFLEADLADGTTATRTIPAPVLHGMPAVRAILDRFDLRYGALQAALDDVVGPAVGHLGRAVTAQPKPCEVIQFGDPPASPRISLLVPIYGRIDFMEIQLALATRSDHARGHDIIYLLDEPARRRDTELLAASAFARFGIPFRLALLGRNLGYAGANNVGLGLARAPIVGLINSDVFPAAPDGFDVLAAALEADPGLGAIGPLLLFEDGTVQHQGMAFTVLPEFAGWHFPLHPRKGLAPPNDTGLHSAPAITAACMVLRRDVLRELGGFDEAFLVGDFEDADLCLRLAAHGLAVAVHHGVRMHHLERQSQAGSEQRWRMNMTLYNAWVHEARWGETLAAQVQA